LEVPFANQLFHCNRQVLNFELDNALTSKFDALHALTADTQPSVLHRNQPKFCPPRVIEKNDMLLSTELNSSNKRQKVFNEDNLKLNSCDFLKEQLKLRKKKTTGTKEVLVGRLMQAMVDDNVESEEKNPIGMTHIKQEEI
jgi:hypothetical protein